MSKQPVLGRRRDDEVLGRGFLSRSPSLRRGSAQMRGEWISPAGSGMSGWVCLLLPGCGDWTRRFGELIKVPSMRAGHIGSESLPSRGGSRL